MSSRRFFFVLIAGAFVLCVPAMVSASPSPASGRAMTGRVAEPRASARAATQARRTSVHPGVLADVNTALKQGSQREGRAQFVSRIGTLSSWSNFKTKDREALSAMESFEKSAPTTYDVPAHKSGVSSALNTQAALAAKALVEAVGPKRALAHATLLVDTAKARLADQRNENSTTRSSYATVMVTPSHLNDANRFRRVVKAVIAADHTAKR